MSNRPHRVILCRHAKPPSGRDEATNRGTAGGRLQLFAFSWADVGVLLDLQPETARKLARAGRFDPTDLASIAAYWRERDGRAR